jgi:hypothetical protein
MDAVAVISDLSSPPPIGARQIIRVLIERRKAGQFWQ